MSIFEKLVLPIGKKSARGWVKWYHKGIPDEEGDAREQARNQAETQRHCKVCTVLSGDYFPSPNMPPYPQHPHCDCMLFSIDKPASQAVASCAIEKFTKYVFLPENSKGKTALFKDLGYTIEDSEYLKSEFEIQAKQKYLNGEYVLGKLNNYGQRITIEIKLKSAIKDDIILKTGWMIRPLGYITCNTPLGDR